MKNSCPICKIHIEELHKMMRGEVFEKCWLSRPKCPVCKRPWTNGDKVKPVGDMPGQIAIKE